MKGLIIILFITFVSTLPVNGFSKTTLQHKVIYEDLRNHVFLIHETDENGNVIPQDFEHPVQLSPEELSKILGEIRYSKSFLFNWRGNYEVFSDAERESLSEKLSRAFQDATPNEWIGFSSTIDSPDLVDPVPLLTDGSIFKKHRKLHVVLLNLKYEVKKKDSPFRGDPRELFSLGLKRINLTEGISAPPVIPGTQFLTQHHNNWAAVDIAALLQRDEETQVKEESEKKVEGKNLVERMRILKEIFDNGLITKKEYEEKKKELLNEL